MNSSIVSVFPKNQHGRDFVVGDIHGCASALHALFRAVDFRPSSDRVFAVGDLIDRGPDVMEVLDMLKNPWFFSVRGNHEDMLLEHIQNPARRPPKDPSWIQKLAPTFTERQQLLGHIETYLRALPIVIRVGEPALFYVVHAELLEETGPVSKQTLEQWSFSHPDKARSRAMYGRNLYRLYRERRTVSRAHDKSLPPIACGHTIIPNGPLQIARQIYLDGGASVIYNSEAVLRWERHGHTPKLHAWEPMTGKLWSVDTRTADVSRTHFKAHGE